MWCRFAVGLCILIGITLIVGGIYGLVRPLSCRYDTAVISTCSEKIEEFGDTTFCQLTLEVRYQPMSTRTIKSSPYSSLSHCPEELNIGIWVWDDYWCAELEQNCPRYYADWILMTAGGAILLFSSLFILILMARSCR